jgi:hypothetical protein
MPGWEGFSIPDYLRESFDLLVLVDNDVNILALGERAMLWPDVTDLVFISIATGIGAGIISAAPSSVALKVLRETWAMYRSPTASTPRETLKTSVIWKPCPAVLPSRNGSRRAE